MNFPETMRGAVAECRRGFVDRHRHASECRVGAAGGNGEEAHEIRVDESGAGTEQDQTSGDASHCLGRAPDDRVDTRDHRQQSEGHDRAGRGVAQRGDGRHGCCEPAAREPRGVRDNDAGSHRDRRGDERQHHGVTRLFDDGRRHARELHALRRGAHQIDRRREEADHDGQRAQGRCHECRRTAQTMRRERSWLLGVVGVSPLSPRAPLERRQRDDHGQHRQRDLCGAGQIRSCHPRRVDRHRERAHAEKLRRADVVERFHQRKAQPDGHGRTGERQRDAQKRLRATRTERARRIEQVGRLHQEHRARRQVDVRIEHEPQQQDAPGHRPHVGQTELARRLVTEQRADGVLDDTHRMQ